MSQPRELQGCDEATNSNSVLQFLLGAAPLASKPNTSSPLRAHHSASLNDYPDDLDSVPLLEYASDVESEDGFLVGCNATKPTSSSPSNEAHPIVADNRTAAAVGASETTLHAATATVCQLLSLEVEELASDTTCRSERAFEPLRNNNTDSDDGLSDCGPTDACGLREVEEEPSALSTLSCDAVKSSSAVRAATATTVESPPPEQINEPRGDSEDTLSTKSDDNACVQPFPVPSACISDRKRLATLRRSRSQAPGATSFHELAMVGAVTAALSLYVVATIYAYLHPVFLPLPPLSALQSPVDLSTVRLSIVTPANGSLLRQPLFLEWQLRDYPAAALATFGPEVFHYRVFVNGTQVVSELGLLDDRHGPNNATGYSGEPSAVVHKTVRQRIPSHAVSDFASYEIELEVTMAVPGSDGAIATIADRVIVVNAVEVARRLELLAPGPGTVFSSAHPVVVQYAAAHVRRLDVVLDGALLMSKRHVGDGTLLLRGLGDGRHTIALVGYDATGDEIPSNAVTAIEVVG